jgi:hypothetical protein
MSRRTRTTYIVLVETRVAGGASDSLAVVGTFYERPIADQEAERFRTLGYRACVMTLQAGPELRRRLPDLTRRPCPYHGRKR